MDARSAHTEDDSYLSHSHPRVDPGSHPLEERLSGHSSLLPKDDPGPELNLPSTLSSPEGLLSNPSMPLHLVGH